MIICGESIVCDDLETISILTFSDIVKQKFITKNIVSGTSAEKDPVRIDDTILWLGEHTSNLKHVKALSAPWSLWAIVGEVACGATIAAIRVQDPSVSAGNRFSGIGVVVIINIIIIISNVIIIIIIIIVNIVCTSLL